MLVLLGEIVNRCTTGSVRRGYDMKHSRKEIQDILEDISRKHGPTGDPGWRNKSGSQQQKDYRSAQLSQVQEQSHKAAMRAYKVSGEETRIITVGGTDV